MKICLKSYNLLIFPIHFRHNSQGGLASKRPLRQNRDNDLHVDLHGDLHVQGGGWLKAN